MNYRISWRINCEGNTWVVGEQVPLESFSGPTLPACDPSGGTIAPNTLSFELIDVDRTFLVDGLRGKPLTLSLVINGSVSKAWGFNIKSCFYSMGVLKFECEDFLQKHINNTEFPNTPLISSLETADVQHSGSEKACVPVVFGTAYAPLRSVLRGSGRWFVLGAADTYDLQAVSSPMSYSIRQEYLSSKYTFKQEQDGGLSYFRPMIAKDGKAGFFQDGGSLADMPTKFSRAGHVAMTSPADTLKYVLLSRGLPAEKIGNTFATIKQYLADNGIKYDCAYTVRRDTVEVICEALTACNCYIVVTDKVDIYTFDEVRTTIITRDDITNDIAEGGEQGPIEVSDVFNFSPVIFDNDQYDSAAVTYFEKEQCGNGFDISVPLDESMANQSSDKLKIPFYTNTELLQKIARLHFRRKMWQYGAVSFDLGPHMLGLHPNQKIIVNDPELYEKQTVIVSEISISPELNLSISGATYQGDIGTLNEYHPEALAANVDNDVFIDPPVSGHQIESLSVGWGTQIDNVPTVLRDTTPEKSLGVTESFIGFRDIGDCWTIKIANDNGVGKFWAGDSESFLSWDGSKAGVAGDIFIKNPEKVRKDLNVSDGADSTKTIIGAGLIATGYIGNKAVNDNPDIGIDFTNKKIFIGGEGELVLKTDRFIMPVSNGVVPAADLENNQGALYEDSGNVHLIWKDSAGTTVTTQLNR